DSFIASMSGVRFVRLIAELAGLPPAHALERAHEAFFYVGLGEVRYRALGTYSLGMKQAAKLAQAIAHGPKLLFLDEPTNGLDPPARSRMIQLIQDIRDRGDLHLILSSHLLRDVEECCDQVLILKDGNLAAFCNLEEERRSNRPYDGALTASWRRLLVIPRYAFEDLHRSRFLTVFFITSFIYPLICALIIYVRHNASVLALLGVQGGERVISINVVFFMSLL